MPSPFHPVLIVDDDQEIRQGMSDWFEHQGFETRSVSNGEEALNRLRWESFSLVMLDLQMPVMGGMEVLRQVEREGIEATIVVLTAYTSVDRVVGALKAGAYDFISKPFDNERLGIVVGKAMERERLRRDVSLWQDRMGEGAPMIIGESPAMQGMLDAARRVARSGSTILLLGESGTGKELLARAIHVWSPRCEAPFIGVNCVAITETLIENELFGHEPGAFTDAKQRKRGKFELADGGTILLDEIGATRLDFQVKLLRVLQEGEFERVGGDHPIKTDARVIAATNRDLQAAIEQGHFLGDLYYRLNVVPIHLPPLRERREDIPALTHFFIGKYATEVKRPGVDISEAAMACLLDYTWPGNIRELENVIERAVVLLAEDETEIRPANLPYQLNIDRSQHSAVPALAYVKAWIQDMIARDHGRNIVESLEGLAVEVALELSKGNKSKAAEMLGLDRRQVERRSKKYGIE